MDWAKSLFKTVMPGSLPFLFLGLGYGILLARSVRWSQFGRRLLAAFLLIYWLISSELGAGLVTAGLSRRYSPLKNASEANGATAVVVLTGAAETFRDEGGTLNVLGSAAAVRALEAARVAQLLGNPLVIVSGADSTNPPGAESESMRDALEHLGVRRDQIVLEAASRDTHEHALNLDGILSRYGVNRFVLVTSAVHLPRAAAVFRNRGYRFIISAPAAEPRYPTGYGLWPRLRDLDRTHAALNEYYGLLYYWARGWI